MKLRPDCKAPAHPPGVTLAEVMSVDPLGVTYTFVDNNGEPTHIASGVLARAVRARHWPITLCMMGGGLLEALERNDMGVEPAHAVKLPDAALDQAVLVGVWGDQHVVIDGNHRLWRRWKRGDKDFPAYVVPESVWRHFVITDVPGSGADWAHFNKHAQVRETEEFLKAILGIK